MTHLLTPVLFSWVFIVNQFSLLSDAANFKSERRHILVDLQHFQYFETLKEFLKYHFSKFLSFLANITCWLILSTISIISLFANFQYDVNKCRKNAEMQSQCFNYFFFIIIIAVAIKKKMKYHIPSGTIKLKNKKARWLETFCTAIFRGHLLFLFSVRNPARKKQTILEKKYLRKRPIFHVKTNYQISTYWKLL